MLEAALSITAGSSPLYMYIYIVLLHPLDQRQIRSEPGVSCNASPKQTSSHIHHAQKPPQPRNLRFACFMQLFCSCFDLEDLALKVRHTILYVFDL